MVEAHEQKSKYKVIIPVGRDGPHGSRGKKALNCQIFIIGNVQFVEIKHLYAGLCPMGYGASTVEWKLCRWLTMSGITTPLKNGSVNVSGSSQTHCSDV